MSATIIAFPFKASLGLDQQRWIPAPRARRVSRTSMTVGSLRVSGIVLLALSSWGLVFGIVRLAGSLLG